MKRIRNSNSTLSYRIPLSHLASLSINNNSSISSVPPYLFTHLQSRVTQLSNNLSYYEQLPIDYQCKLPLTLPELFININKQLQYVYDQYNNNNAQTLLPNTSSSSSKDITNNSSLSSFYISSLYPLLMTINTDILSYFDLYRDIISKYNLYFHKPLTGWMNRILMRSMGISTISNTIYDIYSNTNHTSSSSSSSSSSSNNFVRNFLISDIVTQTTADISAFCIEKYGAAPQVSITNTVPSTVSVLGIPSYIQYAYSEILKNSIRAMLDRYTTLNIDDAPPIHVHISLYNHTTLIIRIEDSGHGIILPTKIMQHLSNIQSIPSVPKTDTTSLSSVKNTITNTTNDSSIIFGSLSQFPYFSSTAFTREENNYQYSREFGVSFTGKGLGLIRSQLACQLHNGNIELFSIPNKGTIALLYIDITGSCTDTQAYQRIQ